MEDNMMDNQASAKSWMVGLALSTLLACGTPPPQVAPTSVTISPKSPVQETELKLSPSAIAWEYAEHGRQRLTYLVEAKEGNGYERLVSLKGTPGGLIDLANRAQTQGVEAIAAQLGEPEGKDDSAFRADYELVLRVGTYRHLGPPLKVPEQGPIVFPDSKPFLRAASSLWLLPSLEVYNPNTEDQLQNFRTYLHIARAISLDAPSVEHYEQGTAFLDKTLHSLSQLVKSQKLNVTQLREVIASLQGLLSSEIELQAVLDTEYFTAGRRLESQKLNAEIKAREQASLAARFLAARPLFADPAAADLGFSIKTDVPEGKLAKEWADKKDFLPALARSRAVLTQLSAVKILAGLEAYHTEKGSYPNKVDELMPVYLSTIPTDWFSPDGRFVYTKTEKGFKLESVSASLPNSKDGRTAW